MTTQDGTHDILVDSAGLAYSESRGEIFVHYPRHDRTGAATHGAGFPIGPVPESYWTAPPNSFTAERVEIWRKLLGRDQSSAQTGGIARC